LGEAVNAKENIMPLDILFWVLMVIWLLFGSWVEYTAPPAPFYRGARIWMGWILLAVLGWKVFGPIVK
jgi:hypothetical protein